MVPGKDFSCIFSLIFWNRIPFSNADESYCGGPPDVPNAYGTDNSSVSDGAVLYYQCMERHESVSGDSYRRCLPSGEWDGEDLECVATSCEILKRPENGAVSFLHVNIGSNATYICFEGYATESGNMSRTCLDNGEWSGQEPTCGIINCPTPDDVEYSIIVADSQEYNSYATYTCYPGYFASRGDLERRCTVSGTWSGTPPYCEKIHCEHDNKSYDWNAKIYLKCGRRQFLDSGNLTRTCIGNNVWSGDDPVCLDIHCPQPPAVANATAKTTDNAPGASAVYRCDKGHVNAGGYLTVSFCQLSGTWSNVDINCTAVYCGKPPNYIGAKSNVTGEMYRDIATYECYIYPDDITIYWDQFCSGDGIWIGDKPRCTGWEKRKFEPVPVEAEGSMWIGMAVLAIFISILIGIVVLDVITFQHHLVYLRRNLLHFRKTVKKTIRALRTKPSVVKFTRRLGKWRDQRKVASASRIDPEAVNEPTSSHKLTDMYVC
ncbi:CUB and sushi domain-containing protein 3 [Patella vulgata]|uniref:CUB and sushi domain-containing protein 3 n=1 Tax=Patella vulgata TaxID=6465 RepID=UPI00217FB1A7|nr:CUB and sushi domain-containing protein 3 [Patella vulgata]